MDGAQSCVTSYQAARGLKMAQIALSVNSQANLFHSTPLGLNAEF